MKYGKAVNKTNDPCILPRCHPVTDGVRHLDEDILIRDSKRFYMRDPRFQIRIEQQMELQLPSLIGILCLLRLVEQPKEKVAATHGDSSR